MVAEYCFRSRQVEWRYRHFDQIQDQNSNGDTTAADHPIHCIFGAMDWVFWVGKSNGTISSWTKFNKFVGEINARGVIRLVIITVHGLFVPWTIRTLDCSYRGLFVPSWTVRTMYCVFVPSLDFSYPGLFVPWTVRSSQCCYKYLSQVFKYFAKYRCPNQYLNTI